MKLTSLESSVFDMYKQIKLGSAENDCCKFCKSYEPNLAGPISFFHIGSLFEIDEHKILFVGRNSWFNKAEYNRDRGKEFFADAREVGLRSLNREMNKSAYWKTIITIIEDLYPNIPHDERIKHIAISNMLKCNTNGEEGNPYDQTPEIIRQTCIKKCGVINREIKVINPKRVIFMIGTNFDEYLDSISGGRIYYYTEPDKTISEGNENKIWSQSRMFLDKNYRNPIFTLRVSHPERKKSDKFVDNIMQWIKITHVLEKTLEGLTMSMDDVARCDITKI